MELVPREVRIYEDGKGERPFESWLGRLRDGKSRAIIRERIARLTLGNFGDCKPVGGEVFELRVAFGPGFRVYYGLDGKRIVVLLCGGDKRSQAGDIKAAKAHWKEYMRLTRDAKRI
jgi:putative addiction module killer protein